MASLHKLLSEGGFEGQNSRQLKKKVNFRGGKEESIALPIYICHDPRSFNSSRKLSERALSLKGSSFSSSRRGDYRDEAAIDDDAIQAVVSLLSSYIGQYLNDKNFRQRIREKCSSCFVRRKKKHSDNEIFSRMEMGIQSIERLVQNQEWNKDIVDIEALEKSIKILNFLASLDSNSLTEDSVSLCACAHLYLSIVYKIATSDQISAKHLLQVFIDAPFLARSCLLPELWEHLYLPHLLHLKIWYNKELDFIESPGHGDKEKKIISLNHRYNDQMNDGTRKFAIYYMEWLKVGAQPASIPSVSLPFKLSRRKSAGSSSSYQNIKNKYLYEAVFGASRHVRDLEEEENVLCSPKEDIKQFSHIKKTNVADWRSSSETYGIEKAELWSDGQKSSYFRFLTCRAEPDELNKEKVKKCESSHLLKLSSISRSIASICSSESLSECEMAIRAVSEAWLDSEGDAIIEASLSQASVIRGIMEVLYESNNNEILELAISLLAELATKKKMNRKCILNSDPQLDVLIRLMRSSSLFLKAAALLYVVKPKAQQMTSTEWIPLVLRVLEFGDQLQTLFSVRCSSHEAAYYFLELLLTGFNRSKNLENAMQIISSGGLSLLVTQMEETDTFKKAQAASILLYCIKADGSCRHYLAENLKKDNIISLFVLGRQTNTQGLAVQLLIELTCLNRRSDRMHFLAELMKGWNSLSTLHILLCNLRRAPHEEMPVIAVLLLLLDFLGDPWRPSVYREEAIDALVTALDCTIFNENVQQQSARALLILGGHFSYTGEPEVETWLLNKACLIDNSKRLLYLDEDESLQIKMSIALLTTGNQRFLTALSDSISHSIPFLSRASLVTICWLMRNLHFLGDKDLQLTACSIVVPGLLECLKDNTTHEENILASFSLHSLLKGTGIIWRLEKEDIGCLDKLSHLTWTAKELTEETDTSLEDKLA